MLLIGHLQDGRRGDGVIPLVQQVGRFAGGHAAFVGGNHPDFDAAAGRMDDLHAVLRGQGVALGVDLHAQPAQALANLRTQHGIVLAMPPLKASTSSPPMQATIAPDSRTTR